MVKLWLYYLSKTCESLQVENDKYGVAREDELRLGTVH
jgi:hypothetical protein